MTLSFFDYYCQACDAPYCERVQIMNLALDITEDGYCLACLATQQGASPNDLADTLKDYIASRTCFLTPWQAFNPAGCPLLATQACPCQ